MAADDRRFEKARRVLESDQVVLPDEIEEEPTEEEQLEVGRFGALLGDRRRLALAALGFVVLLVAIYVLVPKVVGLQDTLDKLGSATWYWVLIAVAFNVASFVAYCVMFRAVLGGPRTDEIRRRLDVRASYQVAMASFAATLLFSAGGAGGLVMTYWALGKAGMPRRRSVCRMLAFLIIQYAVYLFALILFGVLLRTHVLSGDAPLGGTVIPAAVAAILFGVVFLISRIPRDLERRLAAFAQGYRRARMLRRAGSVPATVAMAARTAWAYVRDGDRAAVIIASAVGYWAANIGVLWASFKAFGVAVPLGVVVQGFFVGMAANLLPSAAGGVGSVDAGLIAAFVLFGIHAETVFPAVLVFRAIFFWLPIPFGIAAYLQLRRTVAGWEEERAVERRRRTYTSESKARTAEAT
jgi:uncharacterized protein (TIRG00374 family)